MNPYISDLDFESARERHNNHLRAAQLHALAREAQATQKPAAQPAPSSSLLARLRSALLSRRPARA